MNLKFNYTITEEEYTNYNYYTNRKQNLISFIVILVFICLDQINTRQSVLYAIPFMLLYILYYIFLKIWTKIASRKVYKTSTELQSETEIIITNNELSERTTITTTVLKFENMYKYAQDKISYYIYIDRVKAFIIPKRIMNDDEKQKFEDIMKQYIKNK